jgi:hypothetical protein
MPHKYSRAQPFQGQLFLARAIDGICPKEKKKDAVSGRNGCMQPLQTQNVGEEH